MLEGPLASDLRPFYHWLDCEIDAEREAGDQLFVSDEVKAST